MADNPGFPFTASCGDVSRTSAGAFRSAADVDRVRAAFDPRAESGRVGAVLLQFPWSFRRNEESREWLDDLATTFLDYALVLQVGHSTWNEPAFFRALGEQGIGFVNVDQPVFNKSIAPSAHATSPVGYVLVHGRNCRNWWREKAEPHERYDYLYSAEELQPWAEGTKEIAAAAATADVYQPVVKVVRAVSPHRMPGGRFRAWLWEDATSKSGRQICGSPRVRSRRRRGTPFMSVWSRCCVRTASTHESNTCADATTEERRGGRAYLRACTSGCC